MASPIVFKLRCYPGKYQAKGKYRDMPGRNNAHILYIGKRPGVAMNEGLTHGLFGKTADMEMLDAIADINNAAEYIEGKTREGAITYRGIISLAEEDALRLGYGKRETWEKMLEQNINDIGDKLGIPASRLEYYAAVHMERGHPHIHFICWDNDQPVKKAFVHKSVSDGIRKDLTKAIYRDELHELNMIKTEARDVLSSEAGDFLKGAFKPIADMKKVDYMKLRNAIAEDPDYSGGAIFNRHVPPLFLDDIGNRILNLRDNLPKTGRLNYQFLPEEQKREIDSIIKDLIEKNPDFAREYKKFCDAHVDIASHYTSKPEALEVARKKAEKDIEKRLANRLLKSIRDLNKQQNANENSRAYHRSVALNMMADMFRMLSRHSEAQQASARNIHSELSAQAKKELAIKLESASSIDWERD